MMNNLKNLFALLLVLFTIGCMCAAEVKEHNKEQFENGGTVAGQLPDGRDIKRYTLYFVSSGNMQVHYIYVVDGTTTISKNHTIPKKPTQVEVFIDGVLQVPAEE